METRDRLYIHESCETRRVWVYEQASTDPSRPDRFAIRINDHSGWKPRWQDGKVFMFLTREQAFAKAFAWLYLGEEPQ